MKRRSAQDGAIPPARLDALLQSVVYDRLHSSAAAPDLTAAIMKRLGYVAGDRRQRRTTAWRRWGTRGAIGSLALAAVMATIVVHDDLPQSRRPEAITLPAAVQDAVNRNGRLLRNVIDRVQMISHPALVIPSANNGDEMDDGSPSDESTAPQQPSRPLDDGVERSAIAAVRWV